MLTEARPTPVLDERWALKCINLLRLQPLVEAFDDDASGYVTVAEANGFFSCKPEGWR